MSELQITARFKIHPGKIDAFKTLADTCVKIVRDQDKHTQQYDWFLSVETNECVVRERYPNSEAIMEHLQNVATPLSELLEIADFSVEVCGSPSEELQKAITGMPVTVYGYLTGT